MADKITLVLDTEVYPNYFLAMFKRVDNGRVQAFEMTPDRAFPVAVVKSILSNYRIITFNGIDFDMPLLAYVLNGATCEQVKVAANAIIEGNLRGWQFTKAYGIEVPSAWDHIDLKEAVPGVQISLKLYGARLHSKRLQDLPLDPNAPVDISQQRTLRTYCENDLDTTIDLWRKATDPKDDIMATREAMSAEFGVDLRSKSDAQIAEAVIKHRVTQMRGENVYRSSVPAGTTFRYLPPRFLSFRSPALQAKFAEICAADFVVDSKGAVVMPAALSGTVRVGASNYQMGIGGLHSKEKCAAHVADEHHVLQDTDVTSFYPALIIQCGLSPRNMGDYFQHVYRDVFHRRVAAKHGGDKSLAQTLKIVLNGAFGKLGSRFSVLYSPDLLIQVTVTGQLALLMMIERMEAAGITVVSANTDGVVKKCPVALEGAMAAVIAEWERDTGLATETTRYRALYSRDVNNYVALKVGGGYKTKGVLTPPGVMKNPDQPIVAKAVCDYLDTGKPPAETIFDCADIRQFLRVKRVTGGGQYDFRYLGRVVRWYRRAGESRCISYVTNGNKVGGSDGAAPLMDLPDEFPSDIDYTYYLNEANDLLNEIGFTKGLFQ